MEAEELFGGSPGVAYYGGVVIEVGAGHGPVVEGDETLDEPEVLAGGSHETGEQVPYAPAVCGDLDGDGSRLGELRGRVDEGTAPVVGSGGALVEQVERGESGGDRSGLGDRRALFDGYLPALALAVKVGGDQLVLAGEVSVEGGLGDVGFGDHPVDADGTNALGVEEAGGDLEQTLPRTGSGNGHDPFYPRGMIRQAGLFATFVTAMPVPTHAAPPLEVPLVGGGRFVLAEERPEHFSLVVFYRGWHCPICRGYLAQLDRATEELEGLGVEAVAVSGDDEARARRSVTEWSLERLRVGYDQPVDSMRDWGLFISKGIKDPEPEYFGEPGVFLVRPDNSLYMAALNSMPAARPRIEDLVGAVRFFVEHDYPPRGEA